MKQVDSAGMIVFCKEGSQQYYLLLHYQAGHWDFPKGQIEIGETKKQAAHRELYEETGLKATLIDDFEQSFSYIFTDVDDTLTRKVVHFFLGITQKNDVKLSFEHQDFVWLPYEKAVRKLTYDNAKRVLKLAEEFAKEYTISV